MQLINEFWMDGSGKFHSLRQGKMKRVNTGRKYSEIQRKKETIPTQLFASQWPDMMSYAVEHELGKDWGYEALTVKRQRARESTNFIPVPLEQTNISVKANRFICLLSTRRWKKHGPSWMLEYAALPTLLWSVCELLCWHAAAWMCLFTAESKAVLNPRTRLAKIEWRGT